MKIYLDISCLNRPFDDQTQPRVRLESDAITIILDVIDAGRWTQVSSRMAQIEAAAIADEVRRNRVLRLIPLDIMKLSPSVFNRARKLLKRGLHAADAVHVAAAEILGSDVFLTCDDRLLRKCRQIAEEINVKVANPIQWLQEQADNASNLG